MLWLGALRSSCGMRGLFEWNRQRMYCVSGLSFRERDMLSDADTNLKISEIDAALKGAAPDAPVAFGTELFAALVRAGLVKDTLPAPLDDAATEVVHPSMYREKHPARVETHIANEAFAIGADIQAR